VLERVLTNNGAMVKPVPHAYVVVSSTKLGNVMAALEGKVEGVFNNVNETVLLLVHVGVPDTEHPAMLARVTLPALVHWYAPNTVWLNLTETVCDAVLITGMVVHDKAGGLTKTKFGDMRAAMGRCPADPRNPAPNVNAWKLVPLATAVDKLSVKYTLVRSVV